MADRDLINVDISDVLDWTRDMDRKSRNAGPLMDEIAGLLSENVSENFRQEEGSVAPYTWR